MEDKKIRITVVEQRGSGGMIHYAYQLCTAFSNEGADVELITSHEYELGGFPHNFKVNRLMNLWSQNDTLLSTTPRNQLEVISRRIFWNFRRGLRAIRLITQWAKLTNYLIKTRPSITQFGSTEFPFEAFFMRRLKRHGLIISDICHEVESPETQNFFSRIKDKLNKLVYRSFNVVFLHGVNNQKKFISIFNFPAERTHTIVHGNEQIFPIPENLDKIAHTLKERYGIRDEHRVILFFGAITQYKGVDDLAQAFEQVYIENENARLIIAGMPTKHMDMKPLMQLINSLTSKDAIILDSRYLPMEEIAPLMSIVHVVAYPYTKSSQSGAIQVAYAFGKAVVATKVGGFPDVIEDGKSGYLALSKSPREFASALIKVINNPGVAEEMGSYAKHLSETRFAWEPIARDILDVYLRLYKP